MRMLPLISTALVALLLAGCDGDASPFEEAVEVRELNLTALTVIPPASTVPDLFLNHGDVVQFGVEGFNTASQTVELSASDRQWRVSNSAAASIDDNGRLVAVANGEVSVIVEIGGLESAAFDLEVRDADLQGVDSILGDETVERCLPADYQARGLYSDTSLRDLTGVVWTLAADDGARASVVSNPDINATLTGLNAGAVTLTATAQGFSLPVAVTISDSLMSLDITPGTATLDVGDTQNFVASGTYNGAAPGSDTDSAETRQIAITPSVSWEIVTGRDEATVSNTGDTRGQVSGVASGSSTLNASCGNLSATTPAVITIQAADDASELSFNRSSPVTLDADSSGIFLRVSTGSSYSTANQLDNDDLEWEFTRSGTTDAIDLEVSGDDAGFIRPLVRNGVGTVTVTHPDGASVSIEIEVSDS